MHKFTVGQLVELAPDGTQHSGTANYVIIRLVTNGDDDPQYRVKSPDEAHERVVAESRLTLVQNPPGRLERAGVFEYEPGNVVWTRKS